MSGSVNKVMLIGNLGKDPDFKMTPGGQGVARFSLATTERFTDKSGQRQDKTEWHNIVAWGKTAEIAEKYLRKGKSVYIEGKIQYKQWDDKDGNKKYMTEIMALNLQMLGSPQDSQGGGGSRPPESSGPSRGGYTPEPPMPDSNPGGGVEEDLPF